jgi:hypothetical protein
MQRLWIAVFDYSLLHLGREGEREVIFTAVLGEVAATVSLRKINLPPG